MLRPRRLAAGGWNLNNKACDSLATQIAVDPASQPWLSTELAPLPKGRDAVAAAVVDARLCVVRGRAPGTRTQDRQPLADFDCDGATRDAWRTEPGLPTARGSLAAAMLAGRLYKVGGEAAVRVVSHAVERRGRQGAAGSNRRSCRQSPRLRR